MIKLYICCLDLIIGSVEVGLDIDMKFHKKVMEIVSYDTRIAVHDNGSDGFFLSKYVKLVLHTGRGHLHQECISSKIRHKMEVVSEIREKMVINTGQLGQLQML